MENDETSPIQKTPELKYGLRPCRKQSTTCDGSTNTEKRRVENNFPLTTQYKTTSLSNNEAINDCPLDTCKQQTENKTRRQTKISPSKVSKPSKSTSPVTTRKSPVDKSVGTTKPANQTRRKSPSRPKLFREREDDECSGGIVRWADTCVHEKRPAWKSTRWSDSGSGTDSGSCSGQSFSNNHPQQTTVCQCEKKDRHPQNMRKAAIQNNGQDTEYYNQTSITDIPFMQPPVCPEDNGMQNAQNIQTPPRCHARFGIPPPPPGHLLNRYDSINPPLPSKYNQSSQDVMNTAIPSRYQYISKNTRNPSNYEQNDFNVLDSALDENKAFPKKPDGNIKLISHISGFESQLTVPLNTNYVGYTQKYPQDLVRHNDKKKKW